MSEDVKIPLPQSLQEIIGSLLFASQDPLTAQELRAAVKAVQAEEGENKEIMDVYQSCTNREVDEALKGLGKALEVAHCGFQLVCTGGTYRLQTTPSCGRYVRAMLKMDRPSRLGRASLETLAIIAYRQPLTKGEIEEIRGVDVSGNVKTLMDLQLIRIVGKSELPGHPFLYGTTPIFLEHFGLANLQQLNELDPTLQRSNPRLKAEAYKKKDSKTELEKAAEETEKAEGGEKPQEDGGAEEAKKNDAPKAEQQELLDGVVGEVGDEPSDDEEAKKTDDDDFYIDDTPDEFDEEDDEDEEDGDEDEDEDEDEEDEEDEAAEEEGDDEDEE